MIDGYIKLYRKSIESAVFKDPDLWKLWCLCLMKASHKECFIPIDGIKEPVKLLPGQFITGRFSLHKDYYPQKRKNQKTPITVWRWLEILENMQNLNIKTNNKFSIITIINWDTYQINGIQNDQQNDQQMINRRSTDDHKQELNKNDKKIYSPNSNEFRLANFLFNHIRKRNPSFKEPNIQNWASHIDYMLRLDLRLPEEVKQIIELCQKDDFWKNNILSTEKLRKQYDQLVLKLLPKANKPSFGNCPKCKAPNIDLMENGLCKYCNK